MNLYCDSCKDIHRFTAGDVEQIVYALQGAEHDALLPEVAGDYRENRGTDPDCLKDVLDGAGDSEVYAEHVSSLVECRRIREREARVGIRAFYFGTFESVGHSLWEPGNRRPHKIYRSDALEKIMPWGCTPDGTLNPKDVGEEQGLAKLHHKDGWTALAFANRTDDSRFGSNAVFMFNMELSFDEAVDAAKDSFPQVLERFDFEIREVEAMVGARAR